MFVHPPATSSSSLSPVAGRRVGEPPEPELHPHGEVGALVRVERVRSRDALGIIAAPLPEGALPAGPGPVPPHHVPLLVGIMPQSVPLKSGLATGVHEKRDASNN